MKRSFQVATVFTGAAACTAAFTPLAVAAPATTAKPDVGVSNCAAGESNEAIHLWWPASKHHGPTCVGGEAGVTWTLNVKYISFCAGDNNGWYQVAGVLGHSNFTAGERYALPGTGETIKSIHINGWTGTHYCPYSR